LGEASIGKNTIVGFEETQDERRWTESDCGCCKATVGSSQSCKDWWNCGDTRYSDSQGFRGSEEIFG
jgi:hypothetical protein